MSTGLRVRHTGGCRPPGAHARSHARMRALASERPGASWMSSCSAYGAPRTWEQLRPSDVLARPRSGVTASYGEVLDRSRQLLVGDIGGETAGDSSMRSNHFWLQDPALRSTQPRLDVTPLGGAAQAFLARVVRAAAARSSGFVGPCSFQTVTPDDCIAAASAGRVWHCQARLPLRFAMSLACLPFLRSVV